MLKMKWNNENTAIGIISESRIKPGRIQIELSFKGGLFKVIKDAKYGIQYKEGPFVLTGELLHVIDLAISNRNAKLTS